MIFFCHFLFLLPLSDLEGRDVPRDRVVDHDIVERHELAGEQLDALVGGAAP